MLHPRLSVDGGPSSNPDSPVPTAFNSLEPKGCLAASFGHQGKFLSLLCYILVAWTEFRPRMTCQTHSSPMQGSSKRERLHQTYETSIIFSFCSHFTKTCGWDCGYTRALDIITELLWLHTDELQQWASQSDKDSISDILPKPQPVIRVNNTQIKVNNKFLVLQKQLWVFLWVRNLLLRLQRCYRELNTCYPTLLVL